MNIYDYVSSEVEDYSIYLLFRDPYKEDFVSEFDTIEEAEEFANEIIDESNPEPFFIFKAEPGGEYRRVGRKTQFIPSWNKIELMEEYQVKEYAI